ncbi:hypothetical protein AAVH_23500 [Aphelenchoides avenae]|nr:hypothetical protein AAVH_23500 [Aphelenchus avenae]
MQLEASGEALLDFDGIKKEEIVTKGLAHWQVECKDVNVRVQIVRVKLDKEFESPFKNRKTTMSQVFSLLVEDATGATHVCSFAESAKRLKNLLGDKRVSVAIAGPPVSRDRA